MQHYLVSARKYRPSTFKSVVGQKALTTTLKNAVATGRLAHSYLFCGSRGVGKTSCARIFAKTINCEHPTADGEACNECGSCRAFNAGTSLNIIELDAASNNGVDAIRDLVDSTKNPPASGRYRVFIVDEVHMLSSQAFNAFLKTLEEPPSYVIFILATTEKHKILPTILSRCQIYDFSRITIQDMIDHLSYVAEQEGIKAEKSALNVIARKADGAMRDALSIFDQVAASTAGNITYESTIANLNVLDYTYYHKLLDCFLSGNVLESWLIYKEIRDKGFDSHFFINGLAQYFRDLMVAVSPNTIHLIEAGDDTRNELAMKARQCHPEMIYRAMSLLNDADLNYRTATNKQFLTELTLAKICQLSSPSAADGSLDGGPHLQPIAATQSQTPSSNQPHQTPKPASAAQNTSAAAQPMQQPQPSPARPMQPTQTVQTVQSVQQSQPKTPGVKVKGMGGLRINNAPKLEEKSQAPEASAPASTTPQRNADYTREALMKAWLEFIAANPTEHILINSMRAGHLGDTVQPHHYTMTVESDAQRDFVVNALPRIHKWLHDKLGNDTISVEVLVNQGEASPSVWNEREVLEYMRKHIPDLDNFIADFKLNLG